MNIPLEIKEINEIIEVTDRPEFTLMHRYETGTDEQKYIMVAALAVMAIERERRVKRRQNDGAVNFTQLYPA
ncbi:hypothetical protein E8T88_003826 [Escherichia coli]|nr:hypothetical protein [Escherichia coli]